MPIRLTPKRTFAMMKLQNIIREYLWGVSPMPNTGERRFIPKTLPDFQKRFPNDEACIAHLYTKRFPAGFVCSHCGQHEGDAGSPYSFVNRPTVYRCRNCKRDTWLTAGTIMHRSKQPLCSWFWASFLVTSLTPGMSAVQFKKMLGIKRYETAFQMLHKLRAVYIGFRGGALYPPKEADIKRL